MLVELRRSSSELEGESVATAPDSETLSPASRARDLLRGVIPGLRSLRLAHPGLNYAVTTRLVDALLNWRS